MMKERLRDYDDVRARGGVVCIPYPSADGAVDTIPGAAWVTGYIFPVFELACWVGLVDGNLEDA